MTTKNPFPGLNPFFEQQWRDAHASLILDLQPLIDQCHERGRYHLLNYRLALDPPLTPEDAAWANQLLREHRLL